MRFLIGVFLLSSAVLVCISPTVAFAQHNDQNRITTWGGYSFNSVRFLGKTRNSQSQIFAIGYQHHLKEFPKNRTLWYTADVVPYIHYYYPKRDEGDRLVARSGFGLSPIGFLFMKKTESFLYPYIQTSGGLIYMETEFPTDKARRLNFTFDVTIGTNIPINSFSSISFGYKFHHISNAETGEENPGLDSNFLFVTLLFQ